MSPGHPVPAANPLSVCQSCGRKPAEVGCVLCRMDLCSDCFEKHMLRISADMDEGFSGLGAGPGPDDQPIVCEICGTCVESAKMEGHLYAQHGIMG